MYSLEKNKQAQKDLPAVEKWHSKVTTNTKQLLEKFQLDFELVRDPDSSSPEIIVSTKGGE
jgi:hypothetical protein